MFSVIFDSLLHNIDGPLISENKEMKFLNVWQILASRLFDVDIKLSKASR